MPAGIAITAVEAVADSLREAILKQQHAEKGRKLFGDGRFR